MGEKNKVEVNDEIVGVSESTGANVEIASNLTANLGDCCLSYVPYVTSGSNTTKYGKGRIVLEG